MTGMRSKSKNRSETRNKGKRRAKSAIKFLLTVFAVVVVFLVFYTVTVIANAPRINTDDIYAYLPESSILYDDQGKQIDTVFVDGGNRINIEYKDLPKDLINAVVAIEDKTFWDHHGFNFVRVLGAIKESVFSGGVIGGTSTITQQLARNVYLSETKSVRSLNRKVTEAWYTVQLERSLTKEQIVEAYLNTIYLGNNSYGVEAAARSYFNKPAAEMDLLECAAVASIPKSPDAYALVKTYDNDTLAENSMDLSKKTVLERSAGFTTIYNGDASKKRRDTTLQFMKEQKYITADTLKKVQSDDLSGHIKLGGNMVTGSSVYFSEFVVDTVIKDLMTEGYSEEDARRLIYTGGLQIYTTQNTQAQNAIKEAFAESSNFPAVDYGDTRFDDRGNIISSEGALLLYSYETYLPGGAFTFQRDEVNVDKDGNLTLLKDKRLNFYKTVVNGETDYSIEFKPMYVREDGYFYSIEGGTLIIPKQYKSLDNEGNLRIKGDFFKDYPDTIIVKDGVYSVGSSGYSLKQKVRQPQGAMVICDNKTGAVVAMEGGRDVTGQMIYNRAIKPRQPGSSIKPLAVYAPALEQGVEAAATGKAMSFKEYDKNQKTAGYGSYWTAASRINDAELVVNGKVWPKNAYGGYKGMLTLRASVEQSVNVNAVRVFQQVGPEYSSGMLKKFGVTTVVEKGDVSDMNAAALALGGMTNGISPLEMSSAYTTFPGLGEHKEYTVYKEVKNNKGEVILKQKDNSTKVMDPGVAYIMMDILRTTVSNGIASPAATGNQVTAGKTGTTSNNYDAWFCGFTPQYSAALWIGNDLNIELTEGSAAAARLWGKIMTDATAGLSGSLPSRPSNVITVNGELFVKGTEKGAPKVKEEKAEEEEKAKVEVETCADSGYIACPWCTNRKKVEMAEDDPHGKFYCAIHNKDSAKYPVAPGEETKLPAPEPAVPPKEEDEDNDGNGGDDDGDTLDPQPEP